jgi:tripartite ATP-independent transporter DctM subunit
MAAAGTVPAKSGRTAKLRLLEEGLCFFSLACLALIPLADTLLELLFNSRFPAGPSLTGHLFLLLGLFSGTICTREEAHLSIGLSRFIGNEKAGISLAFFSSLLSAFMTAIFGWCSVSFIRVGLYPVQYVGFIPDRLFALAMPAAYGIIAVRFARQAARSAGALSRRFFFRRVPPGWILPVLALFLGTLCSLPAIFKFIWGINLPDFALGINDAFCSLAALLRIPALVLLILAALGGTPLFVVIGGASLILLQSNWGEIDITANQIYGALTRDSLAPIPLFTLAGFILSESRAGERLVGAFRGLFGWLPGGRVLATVALCAFFTSFTGASGVTILAMGGILYTVLDGYPDKFIIGLLTASGSIGLLFPPSLPILLAGAATRTNTVHLFLGGLVPGLLLAAATMAFGLAVSAKVKIPVEPFDPRKAAAGLKNALLEILLPFLLIAGYFSGIFSMVELSAAAVLYVFIGETFVYRELRLRDLPAVAAKTLPVIGGILSILALAQALSYYIVDSQAPEFFARWMQDDGRREMFRQLVLEETAEPG